MSDQAIIGLVCAMGAGIAALVYYLIGEIRRAVKDSLDEMHENNNSIISKLERIAKIMLEVKETVAVKSTELEYLRREIDGIKTNCRYCNSKSS